MSKFKEIVLIILASILGASIAMFSSKTLGRDEIGEIVTYSIIVVAFFFVFIYLYDYLIKKKYKGYIYISYSTKDKDVADVFISRLASLGYRCLPEEGSFKLGDNLIERLDKDLSRSKALLVIVSSNSKGLKTVNQAIKFMKKKKKKILPVLVGDAEVPQSLSGILCTEYDDNPERTLYLVLEALDESV